MNLIENLCLEYRPKPAPHFNPDRIVITKGSYRTEQQRKMIAAICSAYPKAQIIEKLGLPHNRVELEDVEPLKLHYQGKRTLVLGIHKSALRYSDEDGNTCPNYWHFSPYGFCPYDCQYCYLAGTPGVKYSPTVKIFLNLPEILNHINNVASQLTEPTAFYVGKLQDGLALDPITGYSRIMVAFFARQKQARLILLTKSANVENLLDLNHQGHTILSWSLNPPEICRAFEKNVPTCEERIAAMQKCLEAGYPLRALIMPIIPVVGWQDVYASFLKNFLMAVPLEPITLGHICCYVGALRLTERKLGKTNPISDQIEKRKSRDGRFRFPLILRIGIYKHLIDMIRRFKPELQVSLCMEEYQTFKTLNMESTIGCCNCVH
jgi:spore photoproduct lyase